VASKVTASLTSPKRQRTPVEVRAPMLVVPQVPSVAPELPETPSEKYLSSLDLR